MKIIITEGCTAFNITVDGVSISDLPKATYTVVVNKIIDNIRERVLKNNISLDSLINLLEYNNYETSEEPCDQCGDTVTKTTWEI